MLRSSLLLIALVLSGKALAGIYTDDGPQTVRIHVYGTLKVPNVGGKKDYDDYASGFIVSPDGLIMTAGHVLPRRSDFESSQLWMEATLPHLHGSALIADTDTRPIEIVKSADYPFDVGLFRIMNVTAPLKYLRLCDDLMPDDPVVFLGYLRGQPELSRRQGTVEVPPNDPNPMTIQLPMDKGDSGGPVFNQNGGVVAIGIGQLIIDNDKVESSNLAVMIRNAITHMSPETTKLIESSYDPDCNKQLSRPFADLAFSSTTVQPIALQQQAFNQIVIPAPPGMIYSSIDSVASTIDTPNTTPNTTAQISLGGHALTIGTTVFNQRSPPQFAFGIQSVTPILNVRVQNKVSFHLAPDPLASTPVGDDEDPRVVTSIATIGAVQDRQSNYTINLKRYIGDFLGESLIDYSLLINGRRTPNIVRAKISDDERFMAILLDTEKLSAFSSSAKLQILFTVSARPDRVPKFKR